MQHHAFVIEAEAEEGLEVAQVWAERELKMRIKNNPDVIVLRYGLLSVEDARRAADIALQAPFGAGQKVIIIAANRAYHEAQNALLKLFEEPPERTFLFFILPTLGGLLPTLRSRVQVLTGLAPRPSSGQQEITEVAQQFLAATAEKRSALIKKLTSGSDEEDRRQKRDEAIAIVNGIERAAYAQMKRRDDGEAVVALLSDIATLRTHLYDRSAPVRMILEHLSLVIPKNLL